MPTYTGTSGNDTLNGSSANDTMSGNAGNDTLYADDGNDTLYGGTGHDHLYGGDGHDTMYGDDDDDDLRGDAGDDAVYGGHGNDHVDGGSGNDFVVGGYGNDTLFGGVGNDRFQGRQGDDTVYGGDGADQIEMASTAGNDTIFGGEGGDDADSIVFVSSADISVTFTGAESGTYNQNGGATQGQFAQIERIVTNSGNDTINAQDNTHAVTIDARAGSDIVTGGGGDDHITLGSGDDRYVATRGGGDDIVTDFSRADPDGDGKYADQIDVSNLRTAAGGPVRAWHVAVTDDGAGNAKLTFPEGETLILQGVTPAQMSSASQKNAAGIPCFTSGTLIRTPQGERAIDQLRPGDLVCTRDNGPQAVSWVGKRHLTRAELDLAPDLAPVRIAPGTCGNDRPLLVSPQHGLLVRDDNGGGRERLVRAKHLARLAGGKVRVAHGVRHVTYVHMLFETHQVVYSNSIASESFYPGPWGLRMLNAAAQLELLHLFPELGTKGALQAFGTTARPFAKFRDLPRKQHDLTLSAA